MPTAENARGLLFYRLLRKAVVVKKLDCDTIVWVMVSVRHRLLRFFPADFLAGLERIDLADEKCLIVAPIIKSRERDQALERHRGANFES